MTGIPSPFNGDLYLEALRKSLAKGLLFLRSPFDKLRANGSGVEIVKDFPFVLSLSKHGFVSFGSFDGFRRASQSPQHREELWSFAQLLTQLPRPCVGFFHFRGPIALGSNQRSTQGGLQREFLLGTLGSVRQGREQLEPLGDETA